MAHRASRSSKRRWPLAALLLACATPAPAQEVLADAALAHAGLAADDPTDDLPPLALMGTIPIYWGEADDFTGLVRGDVHPHWAREVLERRFSLDPLASLSPEALARHRVLLMAQPRALSPVENVALDDWVRAGGRLLLFADPMMTGESRFAIGDRRRPQDVALLSPILSHWGLDLRFDEDQPAGLRFVAGEGGPVPVNLPGELHAATASGCLLGEGGLVASCTLGEGRAQVIADAALLDIDGPWPGAAESLDSLLSTAFGETGEVVHQAGSESIGGNENNEIGVGSAPVPPRAGGTAPPP